MGYHQRLPDHTYVEWFHHNGEAAVEKGELDEFTPEARVCALKASLHSRSGSCRYGDEIKPRPLPIPNKFRSV